ncbi:unnamed protein product [Spirodela intermedia]|uniref:Uncharacterized protein n=1 Tax=Spirodela intermedia TaxID=51605 RepID=A0A7I8JZF0_SPIIN|nr:unnamed protein product [Spirodela intermedia]
MTAFPFSRMYDHSLPHSQLTTSDVEGEWRSTLLDYTSDPLGGPARWRNVVDQALISLLFPSANHY